MLFLHQWWWRAPDSPHTSTIVFSVIDSGFVICHVWVNSCTDTNACFVMVGCRTHNIIVIYNILGVRLTEMNGLCDIMCKSLAQETVPWWNCRTNGLESIELQKYRTTNNTQLLMLVLWWWWSRSVRLVLLFILNIIVDLNASPMSHTSSPVNTTVPCWPLRERE